MARYDHLPIYRSAMKLAVHPVKTFETRRNREHGVKPESYK